VKRRYGVVGLIALVFFCAAPNVYGQIFFGITPIRAEHSGNPGKSITDIFYVRNNASAPIRLRAYCENWRILEDGTPDFIGAETTSYSCKDWIKVNPQDFRLMPNEIKTVRYTVTIPSNAQGAGYHAAVSFESVPDEKTPRAGSRMLLSGKIAAAVYVKVGKVPIDGDVVDIKLARKDNSQAMVLVMKNTGKTHFRTKGRIEVFDSEKKKIMDLEVPDEVVLPESEREVVCPLSKALEPGTYWAVCRLDIGRVEIVGLDKALKVEQ
jgi:P pilus assembly chaperone PapD